MPPAQRKTAPMSFRFRPSTVERLRQRVRSSGVTQTDLVERYLLEGMRQDEHPLIHFRGAPDGRRRPMLAGTRLDVADVIGTLRQNENSVEETADYLEIAPELVRAAVSYYAEYKDEIETELAERERMAAEARTRWEREQEALA